MPAHKDLRGTLDWDEIMEKVEAGEYIRQIAREAGCSAVGLRYAINQDPELAERFEAAKIASADALLMSAEQILADGEATASSAHASIARERAGYKKWLAGKRSAEYSDQQVTAVQVNLDVGALHLDALRRHGHMSHPDEIESNVVEALPGSRQSASQRRLEKGGGGDY